MVTMVHDMPRSSTMQDHNAKSPWGVGANRHSPVQAGLWAQVSASTLIWECGMAGGRATDKPYTEAWIAVGMLSGESTTGYT